MVSIWHLPYLGAYFQMYFFNNLNVYILNYLCDCICDNIVEFFLFSWWCTSELSREYLWMHKCQCVFWTCVRACLCLHICECVFLKVVRACLCMHICLCVFLNVWACLCLYIYQCVFLTCVRGCLCMHICECVFLNVVHEYAWARGPVHACALLFITMILSTLTKAPSYSNVNVIIILQRTKYIHP